MRVTDFEAHRGRLFGLAYRMLGSVADAEDVVQEAYLRWERAGGAVEAPGPWLRRVVTRLCLDALKSARSRREEYVGPWLPEPLLVGPDASEAVVRDESVSLAFLVLLEQLTPVERAAFLLREVFDYGYAEIADYLEKSEAAVRQLVHRAKERMREGRPRFRASREEGRRLATSFAEACRSGDLSRLTSLLTADVTMWSDGGGKATAALRPLLGADRVARFLLGLAAKAPPGAHLEVTEVNGDPGWLLRLDGELAAVFAFEVAEDGRVCGIRAVRNPDKLRHLG